MVTKDFRKGGEAMKFITEMELRDLYKTEPFTTYILEHDTKITPGARQFLVDRRVTLVQGQERDDTQVTSNAATETQQQESWRTLRMRSKMHCVESLFIVIAAELLHSGNAVLSEEIMALSKFFQNVQAAELQDKAPDKIQFWDWSEDEIKNRAANLEKHFDISEFHVGLDNGKEIAWLNYLRASLREVEPAVLEAYWDKEQQVCSREDLIDTVNLIINILCMMMWKCLGGQKWKR